MYKITSSHADCNNCELLDCASATSDTNCKDNLKSVNVFIVSENPSKEDTIGGTCLGITYPPGTPLIGKGGKLFREVFNDTIIPLNINYFITNMVLCHSTKPDESPQSKIAHTEHCKPNMLKMLEVCEPDLIISLGANPMKTFGIHGGVTSNNGRMFSYTHEGKQYPVLVATSPNYIDKKGGLNSEAGDEFILAFKNAAAFLNGEEIDDGAEESEGQKHLFNIDPKYYSEDYRLVDIQYIARQQKLIFIFRDKDNNKIFYEQDQQDKNYYWYTNNSEGKLIESFEDLTLRVGNYKQRGLTSNCYESDIRLPEKHAIDYYIQSKGECSIEKQNILFFDIEVYTYDYKGFPGVQKAEWPVNAISFALDDDDTEMYLYHIEGRIDSRIEDEKDKYPTLKIFKSENQMLEAFIKRIHELEPDYIVGWNSIRFDMSYLYQRMMNIKVKFNNMSPFKSTWVDAEKGKCDVTGYICYDMLQLYKNLTYINEPSYKLDSIAQKVLKTNKIEYTGSLNHIYENDIATFLKYYATDTDLLKGLDKALGHVALQDELRRAATTTHHGANSTTGLADGLFNYALKTDGYVMKNSSKGYKESIIGAYVRDPIGGVYDWVIDFDYTSLYPSIICSFNIGPNTWLAKINPTLAHDYTYKTDEVTDKTFDITLDPLYNPTVEQWSYDTFTAFIKERNAIITPSGCIFKNHTEEKSIFYKIIKTLFQKRKEYKTLMFQCKESGDSSNQQIFDNRQMAYKILLNSLYGVLAQEYFRFFNLDLASTVTLSGRELIRFAGEHVDNWMIDNTNTDINCNFNEDVDSQKEYFKYADTDSVFLHVQPYLEKKGLPVDKETIIDEALKIQTYLNIELLPRYAIIHNIDPVESMFELKNELICRRYYTLSTKKKYALHVVVNEGVDTDEVDIKGLEIKRSDYSVLTKTMLTKILDMIIRPEGQPDIDKILDYVSETKTYATQLAIDGNADLFKKVSFNKPLEEYKNTPQHIKGMLIWNALEYEYFQLGSTGILYPLKSFELFNAPDEIQDNFQNLFLKKFEQKDLDVIVLPEDVDSLPDYYGVDVNKIVDFSVNDRADILLEPLVKKTDDLLLW